MSQSVTQIARPETRENWELAQSSEDVRDCWASKGGAGPHSECLDQVGVISEQRSRPRTFGVGPEMR